MNFSNQKRGQKFHEGFKSGIEEVVLLLKKYPNKPIEEFIAALEHAISLLEKKRNEK